MPLCGAKCRNGCGCCDTGEGRQALLGDGDVKGQQKPRTWGDTARSVGSFFYSAANVAATGVTHLAGVPIKGSTFVPHYFYAKIFGGKLGGAAASPVLESNKVKDEIIVVAVVGGVLGYTDDYFMHRRMQVNSGKREQVALLKDLLTDFPAVDAQAPVLYSKNGQARLQRIKDTLEILNSKDGALLKSLEFTFRTLNNGAVLSGLTLLPFLAINALITPVYSEAANDGIKAAVTTGVLGGMSFAWKPIAETRHLDAELAKLIGEVEKNLGIGSGKQIAMTPTTTPRGSRYTPQGQVSAESKSRGSRTKPQDAASDDASHSIAVGNGLTAVAAASGGAAAKPASPLVAARP